MDRPKLLSQTAAILDVKELTVDEFANFYRDIRECQDVIRKNRSSLFANIKDTPAAPGECIICQNDKANTVLKCSVSSYTHLSNSTASARSA